MREKNFVQNIRRVEKLSCSEKPEVAISSVFASSFRMRGSKPYLISASEWTDCCVFFYEVKSHPLNLDINQSVVKSVWKYHTRELVRISL